MAGYSDLYGDVYESDVGSVDNLGGNLFSSTALFPTGVVAGPLLGELFVSAAVFSAGDLTSAATLGGALFQSTPTFPTGLMNVGIGGVLFQSVPVFPQGAITGADLALQGVLFQASPVFPLGVVIYDLTLDGILFISTPLFPQGTISTPPGAVQPFKVEITDRSYRVRVTFPT